MTHKMHLLEWGYETNENEVSYNPEKTEEFYQELANDYGYDNVWDYRILSKAFITNDGSFAYGIFFNVTHVESNRVGSLAQGSREGTPRFYYGFRPN